MSLSSAKAKLDAQGGDPVTGYISKTDHKESYDELLDDTALTGATTAEALDVTGALTAGTIASDATVAGTGLAGGLLSSANPVINGVAAPGTSAIPSRQDHVHASDTTRAPLASPTFTGTVTIPSGLVLGTVTHTEGTGSPQSVVTAIVGSTYIDTAATTGAIKWIKASGTGNTGWVVEYGDTGVRNMAAESMSNGWTVNAANFRLRRVGHTVDVAAFFDSTSASADAIYTLPVGFRPTVSSSQWSGFVRRTAAADDYAATWITTGGEINIYRANLAVAGLAVFHAVYTTSNAWPTSLPGSAA